jgi:hypothetical protein
VTVLDARPATSTGPTVGSTARSARGPLLVVLAIVVTGVALAALSATGSGGRLDPDSYQAAGSRAVAEVLRDQGIPVTRTGTLDAVADAADASTTVVVPFPQGLAASELEALADLDAALLLVGPDQATLDTLELPVEQGPAVDVERRQPACELPLAERAGEVDLGGITYTTEAGRSTGCYASSGRATLLRLPAQDVTILGAGELLTNSRVSRRGNAALALGLLGERDAVVWFLPRAGRPLPTGEQRPLRDLIADELEVGALWLLVTAGVLALWRARRLGRVVEEPLPVVVRAAEAVEGRGRLYRAADARGTAAESLRTATRDRVARRVALPPSAPREEVVAVVAARTGSATPMIDSLLYGGPPPDDAALVRLAGDLRTLESSLTQEVAGP